MRNLVLSVGEFYHVFNRGVDKRAIILDKEDADRFVLCLKLFNTSRPIGSIFQDSFRLKEHYANKAFQRIINDGKEPIVKIIAFFLHYNHYHLIITPLVEGGISKFMQRLGTGYTRYFNEKYKRTGSLFQSTFKARHIDSNNDLLKMCAYVNFNNLLDKKNATQQGNNISFDDLMRSSFTEYKEKGSQICKPDIVLNQFKSLEDFKKFGIKTVTYIKILRERLGDLYEEELYGGSFFA